MPPWPTRRAAIASATASRAGPSSSRVPSGAVAAMPPTACGNGVACGATTKRKAPSSSTPTSRSCQRPDRRTNCRTGRASRNSLATSSSGRSARQAGQLVVPVHRQTGQRCRLPLAQGGAGLDQMDRRGGSRSSGTTFAARSASAISVPRPGPSSATATRAGPAEIEPVLHQRQPDQLAEQLADLRRGDEVAASAEGIAARVVARSRDAPAPGSCSGRPRSGRGRGSAAAGGPRDRSSRRLDAAPGAHDQKEPKASIGSDSSWPMVIPPAR